ncbi:uncharacterized protein LOC130500255 [Raphanus sativus]|uniref:Uncharacterized protein LOC130500255 n=1 Tax=Raphanus sativus TaxID=3726 RepID=A0A9W3CHD7_RAPSA|nr:uncharacterized protein LOC130500255 [Raphanus sativus]
MTAGDIITKVLISIKEWEDAQPQNPITSSTIPPETPTRFIPAESLLCNTGAAWSSDSQSAGLAWIISDQSSTEIARGCRFQEHVASPLMAEALAIRAALEHAATLNLTHIWLRSDCKGLIQAINTNR